jgi:hypothetical protein
MKIDLVGKIKAKRLFELFNTKYWMTNSLLLYLFNNKYS